MLIYLIVNFVRKHFHCKIGSRPVAKATTKLAGRLLIIMNWPLRFWREIRHQRADVVHFSQHLIHVFSRYFILETIETFPSQAQPVTGRGK